jgi:lysophospholipase L1-like esterase
MAGAISNASWQSWFGTNGTVGPPTLASYDPRIVDPTNWASGNTAIGNTLLNELSPNTDTLSFTPTTNVDTFLIFYVKNSLAGTFTWNINGGSNTSVNANNATAAIGIATATGTLGSNTLNVQRSSGGNAYIIGMIAYNSAAKEISIINAGFSAGKISDLVANSLVYETFPMVATLAPDLSIIDCTINDWNAGTDVATFTSNTQSLITQCLAYGDVLLITGVPTSTAMTSIAQQAEYIGAYVNLAYVNKVNLINMTQQWGSWAAGNALGYYTNNVHPNTLGYATQGALVAAFLNGK